MYYKPMINVDLPMPEEMLNALNLLEARFILDDQVSHDQVLDFLAEKEISIEFKPEYLIPL
jgi:hypothetical protein